MTDKRLDAQYDEQHQNRGLDTKKEESTKDISVGLMDIDESIILYLRNVIKPHITDLDGDRVEVPIRYALPEKWKSIQRDAKDRNKFEKISEVPLLLMKRDSIKKGSLNNPVNKYLERNFHSVGWNSRNKYDRFAAVNGITPSQRYVSVMVPDYYDLMYSCVMWTPTIQQLNQIIEQISFEAENYWGDKNRYKFKTSIEEFTDSLEVPADQDRVVRAEFNMKVNAYLLPESTIDKFGKPTSVNQTRFTPKKMVIRERVVDSIEDLE